MRGGFLKLVETAQELVNRARGESRVEWTSIQSRAGYRQGKCTHGVDYGGGAVRVRRVQQFWCVIRSMLTYLAPPRPARQTGKRSVSKAKHVRHTVLSRTKVSALDETDAGRDVRGTRVCLSAARMEQQLLGGGGWSLTGGR